MFDGGSGAGVSSDQTVTADVLSSTAQMANDSISRLRLWCRRSLRG